MSYLLDKKNRQKKYRTIAIGVFILLVAIYFRAEIYNGFSRVLGAVAKPFLSFGRNVGGGISGTGAAFASKKSLRAENENLEAQLAEMQGRMGNYDILAAENENLKEILARKKTPGTLLLAAILAHPNRSLYDTVLIDAGEAEGVKAGDRVFAEGDIPLGTVAEVMPHSAKVLLYSNPGEKTEAILGEGHVTLTGRGRGNFEMILPRDYVLEPGTAAHLPGIYPYVIARTATVISDPRDSFQKALLISPVNINHLKFVEVEVSPSP